MNLMLKEEEVWKGSYTWSMWYDELLSRFQLGEKYVLVAVLIGGWIEKDELKWVYGFEMKKWKIKWKGKWKWGFGWWNFDVGVLIVWDWLDMS